MADIHHADSPAGRDAGEDNLEPVTFAPDEFSARAKAAVLEDEGIAAFVFGSERAWTGGISLRPSKPGVPVLVRRADVDRARAILESRLADSVDLDWNQVEVGDGEQDATFRRSPFIGLMRALGRAGAIVIVIVFALSIAMAVLGLLLSVFRS